MERVDYDPEIDPSIRQEREQAERDRALSARIRLEIERYVADNDLVPRGAALDFTDQSSGMVPGSETRKTSRVKILPPPWDDPLDGNAPEAETAAAERDDDAPVSRGEARRRAKQQERDEKEAAREARQAEKEAAREAGRERRAARAEGRTRAVRSVFTGSILSSDVMRRMLPYLVGLAVILVAYIAYSFQIQKLHYDRQTLEREIRELSIRSVARTAERVRQTRRSAIVERLAGKGIPLEEFPHPVKKIER
ncbi:MAG: hypothetical protein LBU97_01850 [Alistipes sp.]|jgi:hypothetical protein|nr:hypothetical protein [Alistipes sp.]